MTLRCVETQGKVIYEDYLTAAKVRVGNETLFLPLSLEAVGNIPLSEHRRYPSTLEDGGVDICRASSRRDSEGYYSAMGFRLEMNGFLFSITKAAAEKYLPNFYLKSREKTFLISHSMSH